LVHAIGVSLEQRLGSGGCCLEGALGRTVKTHDSGLNVGSKPIRTQQLGLSAVDLAARLVHLEQAIAAVDIARRDGKIEVVRGLDVADTISVRDNADFVCESRNLNEFAASKGLGKVFEM
jgi:hypothetical protein